MSPTRLKLCDWLSTIDVKGKTLDIGGDVWSMRHKVKSFEGEYETLDESNWNLNIRDEHGVRSVGSFDNIFCTEVMQFIWNPVVVLVSLYSSLTLEGKIYFSFHLTHPPMKSHDYLRYTEKGIRKLMEVVSFKIEEFHEPLPGFYLVKCSRL